MDPNTHSAKLPEPPAPSEPSVPVGPLGRSVGLAGLSAVLDDLAAQDVDRLSDGPLAADLLALRRSLDGLDGQWLRRLAAVDGRGAAGADRGRPGPAGALDRQLAAHHWLSWPAGPWRVVGCLRPVGSDPSCWSDTTPPPDSGEDTGPSPPLVGHATPEHPPRVERTRPTVPGSRTGPEHSGATVPGVRAWSPTLPGHRAGGRMGPQRSRPIVPGNCMGPERLRSTAAHDPANPDQRRYAPCRVKPARPGCRSAGRA